MGKGKRMSREGGVERETGTETVIGTERGREGGGERVHAALQLVFCTYSHDSMRVSASVCCLSRQIHLGINRMVFPPAGSEAAKG